VSQENPDPYNILARLCQNSTNVVNIWQRQLHLIRSSAIASNKFNVVEIRDLDRLKEILVAVWDDSQQAIVNKAID